jgi:hypothetical protein
MSNEQLKDLLATIRRINNLRNTRNNLEYTSSSAYINDMLKMSNLLRSPELAQFNPSSVTSGAQISPQLAALNGANTNFHALLQTQNLAQDGMRKKRDNLRLR